jgi:hypothetical protein
MVSQSELRKEAYRYILQVANNLPARADDKHWLQFLPLEELRLIKEGVADPSPALVASLKDLFSGIVSAAAIDLHLVRPFQK